VEVGAEPARSTGTCVGRVRAVDDRDDAQRAGRATISWSGGTSPVVEVTWLV
jgi:hypothetical protein